MSKIKELFHNPNIRKFLSLLSTDILVRGANFLLIPVFLILMPKDEFGIYGYIYNFAITCSLILNLGYHVAIPKLYTSTIEDKKANSQMLFTLTSTLFAFISVLFVIFYFFDLDYLFFNIISDSGNSSFNYKTYRPYLFVALVSMIFSNFLTYYFISAKKIRNIQIFNLLRLFICNGTAILILHYSNNIDTALIRLSTTYICELILCCLFSRSLFKNMSFSYSGKTMLNALKIGLPVCFVVLTNSFINFGDKQFIMIYCGSESMGAYNLATLLATIPLIIFQSFNFIWIPDFLGEKNLRSLKHKSYRNAKIIILLLIAVSIVIWLGTLLLLEIGIFPSNYREILSYLPMLLLSQVFAAMILYFFNFFSYFETTYISMIISIISALISCVAYQYFGKLYGAIGISSSLAVINILVTISYIFVAEYYLNKNIRKSEV